VAQHLAVRAAVNHAAPRPSHTKGRPHRADITGFGLSPSTGGPGLRPSRGMLRLLPLPGRHAALPIIQVGCRSVSVAGAPRRDGACCPLSAVRSQYRLTRQSVRRPGPVALVCPAQAVGSRCRASAGRWVQVADPRYPVVMIGGVPVVNAPQEIDTANAEWFREMLLPAACRGQGTVVVIMTTTRFCDSSGVSVLVRAHERAVAEGGELLLVIPASAAVLRVFAITGIDRLISNFADLNEALAAARAVVPRPLQRPATPGMGTGQTGDPTVPPPDAGPPDVLILPVESLEAGTASDIRPAAEHTSVSARVTPAHTVAQGR
jgi:anti-sigma B factor antagonist